MEKNRPTIFSVFLTLIITALFTFLYIYVYQMQPFPSPWNDAFINYSIFLIAALCAIFVTIMGLHFDKGEQVRAVWGYFALGLWGWALAEGVFAVLFSMYNDVPDLSLADVFWTGSYIAFALSFLHQFRLIYPSRKHQMLARLWVVILAILAVSALTALLMHQSSIETEQAWLDTFVAVFYPLGDLALALAAIRVAKIFGRGMWGRVWAGLLLFVVADAIYSWLYFSGIYSVSLETGNNVSMFADIMYIVAYLVLAVACMSHMLLVVYGPPPMKASRMRKLRR